MAMRSNASHNSNDEEAGPLVRDDESILDRYTRWLDQKPLMARCWTCAVVAALGAMLGARKNSERGRRGQSSIDWMEVVSFALHGGLVAGPLTLML